MREQFPHQSLKFFLSIAARSMVCWGQFMLILVRIAVVNASHAFEVDKVSATAVIRNSSLTQALRYAPWFHDLAKLHSPIRHPHSRIFNCFGCSNLNGWLGLSASLMHMQQPRKWIDHCPSLKLSEHCPHCMYKAYSWFKWWLFLQKI